MVDGECLIADPIFECVNDELFATKELEEVFRFEGGSKS